MSSQIKIDEIPNEWYKLAPPHYFLEMRAIYSVVQTIC